ncbi:uracil-DNA glycosylase [Acinetobacter baumannii]|uniref:uracil-DNA glycosylase n=1 Tax=Acinetobacter baumannii TaxID=470 RepID=UPI0004475AD0|nr:uracil-DNA glycosylase [Acinetobacter baumannii]EXB82689.1 uracil DNA glycosylase superfamily protein [Acinetobacter baumannii 299505]MDH2541568.1 uracil-DNA glycosylase [Acinetobacter baumannii]MDN8242867.1 uracil-DNA glycosylase [Acinetobacter baumannii]HCT5553525.1 uracil-DNA glycosylase [Acinetobacter baumannii]HCT6804036.1 uracil-DNA glycosylase [Acinetobacter baumannii]
MQNFVEHLKSIELENVFNPYADFCEYYDVLDAPQIRTNNLNELLISAIQNQVQTLWIGRDLGHRGGRRTGLALTDEYHLDDLNLKWDTHLIKATKGISITENTATAIWSILNSINENIFLWNVFPLHPHEENKPFTNRQHSAKEREIGKEILFELINILKIKHIVAIGNDAFDITSSFKINGVTIDKVRHPSFGGKNDFIKQMQEIYNIEKNTNQLDLF